jgi:BlaI family transcriptional regulator, penicillinase repressor
MTADTPRRRTALPDKLSRREREIMDALFALGNRASAEEIRARMPHPPSYSAVRAMLVRLEAKGHIRHVEDGLRYIYSATTSPATARKAALQQYLRVFFGGSLGQMMTALLTQERWTDEELDAIQSEIERVRKERKQ